MSTSNRDKFAQAREAFNESRRLPGGYKERQALFIDLYMQYIGEERFNTYNEVLKAAWVDSGHKEDRHNISQARKVLEDNFHEVERRVRAKIGEGAVLASHTLIHLCKNAKQDSVRLKAATELLNKAGYNETQKIELTEKRPEELDEKELRREIQEMMEKEGLKVVGDE